MSESTERKTFTYKRMRDGAWVECKRGTVPVVFLIVTTRDEPIRTRHAHPHHEPLTRFRVRRAFRFAAAFLRSSIHGSIEMLAAHSIWVSVCLSIICSMLVGRNS